eukprot:2427928-Alexandrium_andersonii.AAC.1
MCIRDSSNSPSGLTHPLTSEHNDQNGSLASPEGLRSGVAEYRLTSQMAIRMALWPLQRGCAV